VFQQCDRFNQRSTRFAEKINIASKKLNPSELLTYHPCANQRATAAAMMALSMVMCAAPSFQMLCFVVRSGALSKSHKAFYEQLF
jgi:hypothetical protein